MSFTQVQHNDALASESQLSQALAESRRLWILKNAPNDYPRIYPSDADTHVHLTGFQFGHVPATLDQQHPPSLPHDGEYALAAQLQVLPTHVQPNDALASEFQPSQALAESRRLWILKNVPNDYPRIYPSFGHVPAILGQRRLPGLPHDVEGAAQLQALPTYPNDALASQPSRYLAENSHILISDDTLSYYQGTHSPCLPGLPYDEEGAAQLQVMPTQVRPNDALAYWDADTPPVHFSMPFTFYQQYLASPPLDSDEESPAQIQVWGSEVHPNNVSRLLPLWVAQSTGGAQEQSPGTAQLAGAQEAEPHPHSSAAGGERYSCGWADCVPVKNFTRPQDLARHIREVHDPDSPRKCPLCPPDRRAWKRPYLLKDHLTDVHHEEFAEDDIERISLLKGKNVLAFVDAIERPQS